MNLLGRLRALFRPSFEHLFDVRVEANAPHRVHCFGDYGGSDGLPVLEASDGYHRHSVLDIQTGNVTDLTVTKVAYEDKRASLPAFVESELSKPSRTTTLVAATATSLAVRFVPRDLSATEHVGPASFELELRQVNPLFFDVGMVHNGTALSRHKIEGIADTRLLRLLAVPSQSELAVLTQRDYLWIEIATGRLLGRGTL